ncbi:hypothetical protein ABEB36_011318 [Hypothenemus hampei]|uniref:Retinol dehydrogenase 11 n=1 Tax=Hypothenemus hampei TaxID=57062 RepID=A0ABD1EFJ5_HYPHA
MGIFSSVCTSTVRLDGKTAIITGCNTGIGKETVKDFFERGARVIMACRNIEKATEAANEIKSSCISKENVGELIVEELDLASLRSVRKCAETISNKESKINLLVNNAGVMVCPFQHTEDGFEMQFGTNHLGHFLFTLLLLPKIIQSAPARIVVVSSRAHERGSMNFEDLNYKKRNYNPLEAYSQSKLANVLFSRELTKRLKENNIDGVTVYSLHPGVINTELGRYVKTTYGVFLATIWGLFKWALKTPKQGAQTTIYCSVDEKCANESGLYYKECASATSAIAARSEEDAQRLWDESLKLVGLPDNYNAFVKN